MSDKSEWSVTAPDVASVRRRTETAVAELKRSIETLQGRHLREYKELAKTVADRIQSLGGALKADESITDDWGDHHAGFVEVGDLWKGIYENANEEALTALGETADALLEYLSDTEEQIVAEETGESEGDDEDDDSEDEDEDDDE